MAERNDKSATLVRPEISNLVSAPDGDVANCSSGSVETPERLRNAVDQLPKEILTRRRGDTWSIQENVGHLLDLEPLWDRRLDDYDASAQVLHPADLENRKDARGKPQHPFDRRPLSRI